MKIEKSQIMNMDDTNYVDEDEIILINSLFEKLEKKRSRNWTRTQYYEKKKSAKSLGISLPPELSRLANIHLGWAAKAVDALAKRSRFDGFTYEGVDEDPLREVLKANNFRNLYKQATTSELIHSCSFVTVTAGDDNEPDVVFNFYSATQATANWDSREKRISAGLVIIAIDERKRGRRYAEPTGFILFTDAAVLEFNKLARGWEVIRTEHEYGRPMMEPLIYNPTLTRPFGTSRINRATMSIIDRAGRCALRMDVAAEFFSAPQRYLLGAEEDVLEDKTKWDAYIGNLFAATKDEDGDIPQYGQLPQMSIEPLVGQMRSLAAEFSGETDIPISSLGIIHDNPASAEGIYATKEDLIMAAEDLNEINGNSLVNIGTLALMIINGVTSENDLPKEQKTIMPKFKNPAKPSVVSQSDAIIKQVSAIPEIGQTDVALEELGYSDSQIARMKAQWIKLASAATFMEIANKVANNENTDGQ